MKMIRKAALFMIMMVIMTQLSLAFAVDVKPITPVDPEVKSDLMLGLNQPYGLATDYLGDVYVADTYNNMIKKVTANGLEIVAGGFDGKNSMGFPRGGLLDGKALEARFNKPRDIFITKTGVIYVADTGNHVIRKIEAGAVSTISGTGTAGFKDGAASIAQFNLPSALTMDSEGKLYVADTLNSSIRVIRKDGTAETLSFTPDQKTLKSGKLNEPSDLLFDGNGILYILDSGNQSIKRVENGVISLVAGNVTDLNTETGYVKTGLVNGTTSEAKFNFPKGFALDDKGNLFVADSWNHVIRVVGTDGVVKTYSGAPFSGNVVGDIKEARYNTPTGLIINKGTLMISDMWNNEIKAMPIDYNDISFGYSEEALQALIDPAQTSTDWTFWENHMKVVLEKPIVEVEGMIYLPFKATMTHFNYEISWDAVQRRVIYKNDQEDDGFIDETSGMKIIQNNSYLSIEDFEKIVHKSIKPLEIYKTIIVVD
ncbi:NHL repeat-containing protein [Fusibacter ferrireducens]|uniref:Copper amine oxidase-like N-terminal domain-containing protein n=1 Tax=Fusibacter ferrireducens TaxID=2785058 RepID=A0ABR9ZWA2_9FIRM|nr:hypothetical protein [Fusibacter ferrireducens]MBF4694626.1 hypothetical protein [Fusibacter ferrireducens]